MNFSEDELQEALSIEAISLDPEPPQMILSTNKSIPNLTLRVVAPPQFTGNLDKVYLSFNLIVEHLHEAPRHVSVSEDVIQSALMEKRDMIVAAVFSQQQWLAANCPLAADEILKIYNERHLVPGTSSGRTKTLWIGKQRLSFFYTPDAPWLKTELTTRPPQVAVDKIKASFEAGLNFCGGGTYRISSSRLGPLACGWGLRMVDRHPLTSFFAS